MEIARTVSKRATCNRLHVGAVIVKDSQILSTGYNGAPKGLQDCDTVGHEIRLIDGRESCVRTTHAEMNAIAQAAKHGVAVDGATMYLTTSPCYDCAKVVINSGIKKIVYDTVYSGGRQSLDTSINDLAASAGVRMFKYEEDKE